MMAANYRHIGGGVNRLGRHYSRFSGFWPMASVVDQSLALRKSQNRESNRRRRVKAASRPFRFDTARERDAVAGRCPASVCSRGPHALPRAPMSEFDLQSFKIFFDLLRLDDNEGAPG